MKNGSILTPILYLWLFVVIVGTIGYVLWTNQQVKLGSAPVQTTSDYNSQFDINRDGKVTQTDRQYIRGQLNCTKGQACWEQQIGKTSDGDNPIYTYDLDLDKDEKISELDLSF